MFKPIILAALIGAITLGVQACFSSSSTEQTAATPACNSQSGTDCQSTTTMKSSWGLFF
jgi:FlaG/FlaF family flagellin (archaellin)